MSIISIAIQKGGCGKTTTTINLAAALLRQGKTVLLVDADPQASLTEALGVSPGTTPNLYTELSKEMKGEGSNLAEAIVQTRAGLDLVPSSIDLANAELELISVFGREQLFTWMLEGLASQYDFIFIDCPPSVGMLTVNSLVASSALIMPVQAEYLPLQALQGFQHHIRTLKKLNKDLDILGVVVTRYDHRRVLDREAFERMKKEFGEKLFQTPIRNNCRIATAQKEGLDIFSFDPKSHGAEDYSALAMEFLERTGNLSPAQADNKSSHSLQYQD
jgi:chromosome partitioning protein